MCGIWAILGSEYNSTKHEPEFMKIVSRGPDFTIIEQTAPNLWFGFHRLAIVQPGHVSSSQPIVVPLNTNQSLNLNDKNIKTNLPLSLVCNGEIYNHIEIKEKSPLSESQIINGISDCAAIAHAFRTHNNDLRKCCASLDGVFAFLMTDTKFLYVARDPIGIRPLFYGITENGFVFGSEIKCIEKICNRVRFFPPGCCAQISLLQPHQHLCIEQYYSIPVGIERNITLNDSQEAIRNILIEAVKKRLMGNRNFGFMLSGGLDSSLIASIATKLLKEQNQPIPIAFSVGFEDSPDLENAKNVAKYLNILHHVIVITPQDCINAIPEVVFALETFDPLLIRCGVAHYLLCKYIAANSDVKVLLSGEGADELFGSYAYMQRAPTHAHLHREIHRRLRHLHQYDVLRCDRSTSCHGLEIRVPFLDKKFINYATQLSPSFKLMANRVEKFVLRSAFKGWLPDSVLWRNKEGFSEALGKIDLGHELQEYSNSCITDLEFLQRNKLFKWHTPQTKEEYWYRSLFEKFFDLQKVYSVIHIKVYKTADWHLSIGSNSIDEKENFYNESNDSFVADFSKEEREIRFRLQSTEISKWTGVA